MKTQGIITGIAMIASVYTNSSAQNLVPNPSFEVYDTCPPAANNTPPWYNPTTGSPDYFNACDTSGWVQDVPVNYWGTEPARTGVGYWGFIPFIGDMALPPNGREYIQVPLTDSLVNGNTYCVEFYTSLADSSVVAVNDLGIYFSSMPVTSNDWFPLPYTPQVSNPSSNPLTNKNGWTQISGIYTAAGGERYITIGNFKDDANTDTIFVGGAYWDWYPYYYIDDVSVVSCDSTDAVEDVKPDRLKFYVSFYNNTLSVVILGKAIVKDHIVIDLLDILGKRQKVNVFKADEPGLNYYLDVRSVSSGIYFLRVSISDQKYMSKVLLTR